MEEMERICFELICNVGDARSSFIESIHEAKKGDFEKARERMKSGQESFSKGHHVHADLISKEANGNTSMISLLLIHAEDQLMSAETFKILSEEFIELYERLS